MIDILFLTVLTLVLLVWDLKYKKIPNALTAPSLLIGFLLAFYGGGIWDAFLGFIGVIVIFIPLYFMGSICAGDVKYLMNVGVFLGWDVGKTAFLMVILTNLIFTLIVLIYKRKLKQVLKFTLEELKYRCLMLCTNQKKLSITNFQNKGSIKLPYMPAAAVGVYIAIFISFF